MIYFSIKLMLLCLSIYWFLLKILNEIRTHLKWWYKISKRKFLFSHYFYFVSQKNRYFKFSLKLCIQHFYRYNLMYISETNQILYILKWNTIGLNWLNSVCNLLNQIKECNINFHNTWQIYLEWIITILVDIFPISFQHIYVKILYFKIEII